MTGRFCIAIGRPSILEFRGPDAVRFLNGQVTQDVRRVLGAKIALPSCVTDAKGRLQFRVFITESEGAALWIIGSPGIAADLEARLTRYLIADDVEKTDRSGQYELVHFTTRVEDPPPGVLLRESFRFGHPGTDCLTPADQVVAVGDKLPVLEGDALEDYRIANRIPRWGAELTEGMLPPEAGLDQTDISYVKGCYIGQEVISRIKSAGKVNRRLTMFLLDGEIPAAVGDVLVSEGGEAGVLTSVSPLVRNGSRCALGYVKRGHDPAALRVRDVTGAHHSISLI